MIEGVQEVHNLVYDRMLTPTGIHYEKFYRYTGV